MNNKPVFKIVIALLIFSFAQSDAISKDKPVKMGTTAASFLEIGVGSAAVGMGSAYTTMCEDLSAIYWNPSKLAHIRQIEGMFMHQPWLVDINFSFLGGALPLPGIGVVGLGVTMLNSGDIEETTLDFQDGTGSYYDCSDIALSLCFAREMTDNFSVGFAGKYITQRISTMKASALAIDMGVYVVTPFFARPDGNVKGMQIGMCISNYGGKMRMLGDDTYIAVDPDLNNGGNNELIEADYRTQAYNLPSVFRVGIAYDFFNTTHNRVTFAADALHPNNNYEYINTGLQYQLSMWDGLVLKLRGGYKTLFLEDSMQGLALGFGLKYRLRGMAGFRFDYAFSDMNELGKVSSYTLSLIF
ncbi:PorV/PorQ family protein [candidate division KSB1 bacterium]|nr:PorV/PorQ family protein [candidate division KSB1 bacterium]